MVSLKLLFKRWWHRYRVNQQVSIEDVAIFLHQLSILLSSSVPIVKALLALSSQNRGSGLRKIVSDLRSMLVSNGQPLSAGFAKYPQVFPAYVVLFAKAGEQTGALDARLESASKLLTRSVHLKKKIQLAMTGPAITVAVALTVMIGCSKFVIPRLGEMYSGLNAPLPLFTQAVMLGAAIVGHPITWIAAFLGMLAIKQKGPVLRERCFVLSLQFPLTRRWVGALLCSEFCDVVGSLVKDGVGVLEALRMVADNAPFRYHAACLERSWLLLREQGNLVAALASIDYFPKMLEQMAAVSLEIGSLDSFLRYLSQMMRDEVDLALDGFVTLLEPILIGGLGLLCATLMVALFLPLYGVLSQL